MITTTEASVETSITLQYDNLTYIQKQKYDYLFRIYEDIAKTVLLVSLIDGRGKNSWNKVYLKIVELETSKSSVQQYQDALYDNYEIDVLYTSSEIIGIVAEVRRDLGLPPYLTRLKINCENDFFNLFIIHDDYSVNSEGKRKLIGHRPKFKLKPED